MSYDALNITKFYERKLIQKLLAVNRETSAIFGRYIQRVTPIIQQYRYNKNGVVIRDPKLEKAINVEIQRFSDELKQYVNLSKTDAWMLAEEKANHMIDEYIGQMAAAKIETRQLVTPDGETIDLGGMYQRNVQAMETFMARKAAGMNLSQNVWKLAQNTKEQLEFYLQSGLATGRSADVISRDIRNILNEPDKLFRRVRDPKTGKLVPSKPMANYHPGQGVYRSSYKNARRLARTEINMAYRASDMESYRNSEVVIGYQIKLSPNHPVPDICDSAAGVYPKDFHWIGWHPQCRCFSVPVTMTLDQLDDFENGEPIPVVNDVPENFKNYMKEHRDQFERWNTKPYFIGDNQKIVDSVYSGKKYPFPTETRIKSRPFETEGILQPA